MASSINASTSPAAIVQTADGTGILALQTAGTTAVTVDASQNVLIGATSASGFDSGADNLIVGAGSGSTGMTIYSGTAGVGGINFADGNSGSAIYAGGVNYNHSTNQMSFYTTDGTGRMYIDSSGALLVNTTSAIGASKFVIAADTTSVNPMAVSNTRSTASTDYSILFYRNANLVGSVQTTLAGVTSYVTSSDYRLKQNILPMTGVLTKVMQLKPVTYKWKSDNSDGQGFIAHELQEVVPEAVCGEKDAVDKDGSIKPQGVDTSFLVATLTAAIQEQQALITSLTARITALEGASL
jgi:hypothetical protein